MTVLLPGLANNDGESSYDARNTNDKIVKSLDAKLQTAASATKCPSVKNSMIHSIGILEIPLLIMMSGRWQQSNKTTSRTGLSQTVFVASRIARTLVS